MHGPLRARMILVAAIASLSTPAFADVTASTRDAVLSAPRATPGPRDVRPLPPPATSDAESRRAAREALKREIASLGMVALVRASLAEARAPAPWLPEATVARLAARDARGPMWRGVIEDAGGVGDLRLTSTGDGVPPVVPATGRVRTAGGGDGIDDVDTFANHVRRADGHEKAAPAAGDARGDAARVAVGERVQRIIRDNFGGFEACYARALVAHPALRGRIAVKLEIDGTGSVTTSTDAGSDLPDADAVACVVRSFATLVFPATGKTITVVYPLTLRPPQ